MELTQQIWRMYKAIKSDKLTKQGRVNIDGVHLNGKFATVTNGHFLIRDRKDCEEMPQNVIVKPLSNTWNKVGNPLRKFDGVCAPCVSPAGDVAEVIDGQYPECEQVIPKSRGKCRIAFNADYLARISEYLNMFGDKDGVVLEFDLESDGTTRAPIRVTKLSGDGEDTFAILMPMKLK